jgi:hypothetical protein
MITLPQRLVEKDVDSRGYLNQKAFQSFHQNEPLINKQDAQVVDKSIHNKNALESYFKGVGTDFAVETVWTQRKAVRTRCVTSSTFPIPSTDVRRLFAW